MKVIFLIAILLMASSMAHHRRHRHHKRDSDSADSDHKANGHHSPIIHTHAGRIQGRLVDVDPKFEVYQFTNIPYAEAPVHHRRFKRPHHKRRFHRVFRAVHTPHACPYHHLPSRIDVDIDPDRNITVSEDCLRLNIWVPKNVLHRIHGHLRYSHHKYRTRRSESEHRESDEYFKRANSSHEQYGKHHEVYRSHERHGELPVLVYIHGGHYSGEPLSPFDGAYFAAFHDIVVVTVQYRVGLLGFAYTNGIDGNMGLWDQLEALRWVHRNIHAFGGDKHRVTLSGQGFGGVSVSLHMLSHHSRRYFNKAIIESSTFMSPASFHSPHLATELTNLAFRRLEHKHCHHRHMPPHHRLRCLRRIHLHHIIRAEGLPRHYGYPMAFSPVIDGDFIRENPIDMFTSERFYRIPLLIGTNRDEGTKRMLTVPGIHHILHRHYHRDSELDNLKIKDYKHMLRHIRYYFDNVMPMSHRTYEAVKLHYWPRPEEKGYPSGTGIVRAISDIIGDRTFTCPTYAFATIATEFNDNIFMYDFTYQRNGSIAPKWMGAPHGSEVPYLFGEPFMSQGDYYNYTETDKLLSRYMMAYWANFVQHGNPNGRHRHDRKVPHSASHRTLHWWPRYKGFACPFRTFEIHPDTLIDKTRASFICGLKTSDCSFWYEHIGKFGHHAKLFDRSH